MNALGVKRCLVGYGGVSEHDLDWNLLCEHLDIFLK
jgi:hypothetical protein